MAVWYVSDPHIGHPNCCLKHRGFKTMEEHNNHFRKKWLDTVGRGDKVFLLGDVGWNNKLESLDFYKDLPGFKHLIMGNHDMCDVLDYRKVFDKVGGMVYYKNFVLTHCPVHPEQLRGRVNIHGHDHTGHIMMDYENGPVSGLIKDPNYINANVDMNDFNFLNHDELHARCFPDA